MLEKILQLLVAILVAVAVVTALLLLSFFFFSFNNHGLIFDVYMLCIFQVRACIADEKRNAVEMQK